MVNVILKEDMRRWTEEVGEEVEWLTGVDSPIHKEAWYRMKG